MFLEITGFWLVLLAIIAFILIIGIIISLHELGHLIVAKKSGILCHEYSIGFGPIIYKHQFKETLFCIRLIPLGGYVQMAGEQLTDGLVKVSEEIGLNLSNDTVTELILGNKMDAEVRGNVVSFDLTGKDDEPLYITINDGLQDRYFNVSKEAYYVFDNSKRLQIEPYERSFDSKHWLLRLATLFAGPFMNFILAMVIYLIVSFATGVPNMNSNTIGSTMDLYPVANILEAGDEILAINDVKTNSWYDVTNTFDKMHKEYVTSYKIKYKDKSDNNIVKEDTFEAYSYVVSIGLSNIGVSKEDRINRTYDLKLDDDTITTITGLKLGTISLRYKNGTSDITKGDIITSMKNGDDVIYQGESLTWGNIIKYFYESSDNNLPNVTFTYYHYNEEKDNYTYQEKSEVIEPYTHEVLESQNVEYFKVLIGVSPSYHFSFFECIGDAFMRFGSDFTIIFRTLKLLIWPQTVRQISVNDLSSFVGIFAMIQSYINSGFLVLLAFMAMLSVNIGIMNLLPIPALDGGRIVFVLVEAITRKKVNKKVESIINTVFFVLLMILLVYITIHDIMRFF